MADWRGYRREARRFWEVARAFDRPGYANQAVSNAAHAAIAANDAVCLYLINEQASGESHAEATRALKRACKGTQWEAETAQKADQLSQVLEAKSASQYRGTALRADVADRVMKQAQRFLEWTETILPRTEAGHKEPPEQ